MKINRKFIARKSYVSPTTVSDVLNNNPKARIGKKTRERVIKVAKQYNYFPNIFARSLVMKKTFNIGFISTVHITAFLNDPFSNSIFVGLESAIEKTGYSLVFSLLKSDNDINFSVRKMIQGNIVDGVILYRRVDKNLLKLLADYQTKFVLIDNHIHSLNTNSVLPENVEGAYKATKYLIEKKAKKIYCLNSNEPHPSYIERPTGYKKAMEENNLSPNVLVITPYPDIPSTYNFVKSLIQNNDIPDAFFAAGDHMAIGAVRALKDSGIKIPEQVRVIGFDNIQLTELETPQITTVNVPKIEMGEEAVKLLLGLIEDHNKPSVMRLKTELVLRESA